MKTFFKKRSRPTNEEKKLRSDIIALYKKAEAESNVEFMRWLDSHESVVDYAGLVQLLNECKNFGKTNNISSTMSTPKENSSSKEESGKEDEGEDEPKFEPTIDIQKESQFSQPIVERPDIASKYRKSEEEEGDTKQESESEPGDDDYNEPREEGEKTSADKKEPEEQDSGDLPPGTKTKAINDTADLFGKFYEQVLPYVVKRIAKISDRKMEKMHWEDELDLNMRLRMPDGKVVTVRQYIEEYNDTLDAKLVITEDQVNDWKKALKGVLRENKKVVLTPMQQFLGTTALHFGGLAMVGLMNVVEMRQNMAYWKEAHEDIKSKRNPQPAPKKEEPKADEDKNDEDKDDGENPETTIDPTKVKV